MNKDQQLELIQISYEFFKVSLENGYNVNIHINKSYIYFEFINTLFYSDHKVIFHNDFESEKELLLKKITEIINIYYQI